MGAWRLLPRELTNASQGDGRRGEAEVCTEVKEMSGGRAVGVKVGNATRMTQAMGASKA